MKRLFVSVCVLLSAAAASAGRVEPAIEAMAERRPDDAVKALRAEITQKEGKPGSDRLHYLLARAEYQAKRYQEAIRVADNLRERWPSSPFARKANFLKADCYATLKDFKRADEIY